MSCNKEMAKVINVLNELQNKILSLDVNEMPQIFNELPQIVVIGSQSAGKSSVLESFVGRDFLPRGTGIVTRRPLILQLQHNKTDNRVFGKFSHKKEKFTDFNEIRLEIQRETDRLVPDSGISSKPIKLVVTSPDVLDLNLIDLPGMTRVPVKGQPSNIEKIIRDLVLEHITNENSIILAVTPANQDLATSDAIKLAQEVDPEGMRTIGVLTKLDLMDKGTNAMDILLNRHQIQLHKGFIGVVNRSTQDIERNKDLREALEYERNFFSKPPYSKLREGLGIVYLQNYLQKELSRHLFKELPTLGKRFISELVELNERIGVLSLTIDDMTPFDVVMKTVKEFKKNFSDEIGTGDEVPVDRDNSGTNINIEVNIKYAEEIETIKRDKSQLNQEITRIIKNIFGAKNDVFVPNKAFKIIARKQIEQMRKPSHNCIESVCIELELIVRTSAEKIEKFPKLSEMYTTLTLEFLSECKKKVKVMVDHTIDMEKDYMSPNHTELIKKEVEQAMSQKLKRPVSNRRSEKDGWIKHQEVDYYFVLQNRILKWYPDIKQNRIRGQIYLRGVETSQKYNYIVLKKYSYLLKEETELKLVFESEYEAVEWGKAILDNAYEDSSNYDMANAVGAGNVKYVVSLESEVERVRKLVMAYVKITEQTLKDRLSKLCQKELIDATEHFVGDTLAIRFQRKEFPIDELVDMTPLEVELNHLKDKQTLYSDAVQAITTVMKSSFIN